MKSLLFLLNVFVFTNALYNHRKFSNVTFSQDEKYILNSEFNDYMNAVLKPINDPLVFVQRHCIHQELLLSIVTDYEFQRNYAMFLMSFKDTMMIAVSNSFEDFSSSSESIYLIGEMKTHLSRIKREINSDVVYKEINECINSYVKKVSIIIDAMVEIFEVLD